MSQADYADLFWNAQEMGINALMLYLTVISGYLVVAYLVGSDLSRNQSRFISALFVVFAATHCGVSRSIGGLATSRESHSKPAILGTLCG
jgi:hypothetical protein